jgi:type IV pilus assembly protein PilM
VELGALTQIGRLPDRLGQVRWLRPRYPLTAVEVREDAVLCTRAVRRKGRYHMGGSGRVELPSGVFSTAMIRPQIGDLAALREAVAEALRKAGAESVSKISLALPDTMARAFVLDFQEVPSRQEQVAELIRWRLKKSVPFELSEARLSWQHLGKGEDGHDQLLIAVAPSDGLRVFEEMFASMGITAGLIDLASLGTVNALRVDGRFVDDDQTDTALLSATRNYFSLVIQSRGRVVFYRAKNYHVQGGYQGEESLRVVGRELRTSLSYYEEHLLGRGLGLLRVRVVGIEPEGVLQIARDSGCENLEPAVLKDFVPELEGAPPEEVTELMPTLGLVLRREP